MNWEEEVIPLEVKAGLNTRSRSLGEFIRNFHPSRAVRLSLQNDRSHQGVFDLPLYDIVGVEKILDF